MASEKFGQNIARKVFLLPAMAGLLVVAGCNNGAKFPDSVDAVNTALVQNNLGNVHVAQDREKGVITLTGAVATDEQKTQAQSVAMEAAATYTVRDDITVAPSK